MRTGAVARTDVAEHSSACDAPANERATQKRQQAHAMRCDPVEKA